MNRSTVATIAVMTLLLGSGVSGLMFVKPAFEEQGKLKQNRASLWSQKSSLSGQVADLEARVKRQAMGAISYFDLRTTPNPRRALEMKTVTTLATLTEIFNDNKIDVQALDPKGETQGLNKPVPTPGPTGSPAAGASPAPAAAVAPAPAAAPTGPPTEPPVQLTHKAFAFSVRGEYPNLVRALSEIEGLPKAISINQFRVALVKDPRDTKAPPARPGEPEVSSSMLELDFQLSITYLMAGGLPAAAPAAAPPPVPSPVPVSLQMLQWATSWLGEPAYAAAAQPVAGATPRARFDVTGVAGAGGDLIVRTRRGVPSYRFSGSSTRLVIELADTRLTDAATLAPRVPGVRAVSARPSSSDPAAMVLVIETDGTRFAPQVVGGQLRLKRVGPASKVASQALRADLKPVSQVPAKAAAVAAKPAVVAAKPAAAQAAAVGTAARRVDPAARQDTASAATWSSLADRAAAEWASTQGGDPTAFKLPVGPAAQGKKPGSQAPAQRPAAPMATPGAPAPAVKAAQAPVVKAVTVPGVKATQAPVVKVPAGPAPRTATRVREVTFEGGALVVRTEGPAPTFRVVGGDRRTLVLELEQALMPGAGRVFPVGEAGVKQVRAVLYDNHPPRVRVVVDTDGSVAVHPVVGPDGVLRLRLATRPGLTHEVRLASATTSAIVTTTRQNPVTRDPSSVRGQAPAKKATPKPKPKPRPVVKATQPQRRVVRGPAASAAVQRAAVRRAKPQLPVVGAARPRPQASPTPMAKPTPIAKGVATKPTPTGMGAAMTPMPTSRPTPPGPSLTRSLTSTYDFPIDREKTTGRQNPFKPLNQPVGQPTRPGALPPVPGKPGGQGSFLPGLPVPGAGGSAGVPAMPKAPSGAGGSYKLGGVMVGGSAPPMALISVDGKAYTVGLNETLPGNARVTAIKVDHVILSADGRSIRLSLQR